MKKHIIFTFDYELFLGVSGSAENCLIIPTNKLLDVFKANHATVTFFVDVTYLLMLKKEGVREDFDKVSKQIQRMALEGHEVALHIHPHWVDAKYEEEFWLFKDFSRYKIGKCDFNLLEELFSKGISLLTSIVREVNPDYKIQSFRAGGWCVDPFTNIKPLCEKYGIRIDSSVIPHRSCVGNSISSYDYTDIKDDTPYRFSMSVHKRDAEGAFIEMPISTYRITPYDQVKSLFMRKFASNVVCTKRFGDGKSVFDVESNSSIERYIKYFKIVPAYYSCDAANEQTLKRIQRDKRKLLTIVSHPKCQTPLSIDIINIILADSENSCVSIVDYLSTNNGI